MSKARYVTVWDRVDRCCVCARLVCVGDLLMSGYGGRGEDPVLLYIHRACVPAFVAPVFSPLRQLADGPLAPWGRTVTAPGSVARLLRRMVQDTSGTARPATTVAMMPVTTVATVAAVPPVLARIPASRIAYGS